MTVLGIVEDLDIRMVRTKVTGSTGFRFSRLGNGEAVSGVTGHTVTYAAIGIYGTDTGCRPGLFGWSAVGVELNVGAVTLHTAGHVSSMLIGAGQPEALELIASEML